MAGRVTRSQQRATTSPRNHGPIVADSQLDTQGNTVQTQQTEN